LQQSVGVQRNQGFLELSKILGIGAIGDALESEILAGLQEDVVVTGIAALTSQRS
jgi:hypothetical protein